MSSVNNEEKQLLFEYSIGLTSQEQSEKARQLIKDNKEASVLYSKMKAALKPLDSIEIQNCPDDLVERTLLRVRNIPNPNRELTELLRAEQNKRMPVKIGFLKNFIEVAAIAAAIMFIAGILVPTFGYARNIYGQKKCAAYISDIFDGYNNYRNEHDGQTPSVSRAKDSNWLKEPNTSHMYLLVIGGYVEPSKFVCPSNRQCNKNASDKKRYKDYLANYQNYNNFPYRCCCTYSFPVMCQKNAVGRLSCRRVIMADSNPIFSQLPQDPPIKLRQEQLQINSYNHNNRGQNVLFGDGHVKFIKDRQIDHDDIYTLQEYDEYVGNETPSCLNDRFLP